MIEFLTDVCLVSEKAALIARTIRKEKDLFSLLIEEKTGICKNERFGQDFKTLSDVLIQETVRHDLSQKYPILMNKIKGEENNEFTNTLGESIHVKIFESCEATSQLLSKVLTDNMKAANILANCVHSKILKLPEPCQETLESLVPKTTSFDLQDYCIWIDPIDSTSNYIFGTDEPNGGLNVVTVLIGVFNEKTGIPVLGVINRPFVSLVNSFWSGEIIWGLSTDFYSTCSLTSLSVPLNSSLIVLVSSNENERLKKFLALKFEVIEASGAGYKILMVCLEKAHIYLTSQTTTFKWDTCAGHAILKSLGGDVVAYEQNHQSLDYHRPSNEKGISRWSNSQGLIAFKNPKYFVEFCRHLSTFE